jgi:hypothetical protein
VQSVVSAGLAVFSALANTVIVLVLTSYFLADMPRIRTLLYRMVEITASLTPVNRSAGRSSPADPLQLVDLGEQRLQTRPARVLFEFGEQSPLPRPRRGDVTLGDQPLKVGHRSRVQPGHGGGTEPVRRDGPGAGDQPAEATRRFQSLTTAAEQQRLPQPLVGQLQRGHFRRQPAGQSFLVSVGRRAETQRVTDLRPVVLDRAAGPHVPAEQGRIDP